MFVTYKQFEKLASKANTEEEFNKIDSDYHESVKKFINEKKQLIISALEHNIKIDLKGFTKEDLNGLKTTNDYDEYILNAFGWFEN